MSVFPHSRVFIGPQKTVDITGPHVQVLDTLTGDVLYSSATFPEEHKESLLKSGPIRCAAVDREVKYLLISGEDKMLKLWEIEGLKLINERELPKKPTSVAFTANAETLVVSDKFGDIFSYPFAYTPPSETEKKDKEKERARDAVSSHENPSDGQLILGHASPLNAFLLTQDEKYIVTADRDEHIRVSWFPKGYNIEMYCLGHLKFVSAIHIPKTDAQVLISGGGDPMLKIWDWMSGTLRHQLPVLETVEPFIAVRASRKKSGDDEEEGGAEGAKNKGKSQRRKARKNAAAAKQVEGAGSEMPELVEKQEESKPEKVLVIHRIESVDSDYGPYIVFSAVGATALFSFPYKADVLSSDIKSFDFGKPVLDFSVVNGSKIVAEVDRTWAGEAGNGASTSQSSMVKVLTVSGGDLTEDADAFVPLINSLNSKALLLATPDALKKLSLYSDLVSLPKYADPDIDETEATAMPIGAPEISSSETAKAKGKANAELSKKELGRIKTKQAVMAKAMEVDESTDGKENARKLDEVDVEENGPETKRARSDIDMSTL